ncbi:MAG: Gfo/Idh/MocA family oxidoreductase [Chloroflexi bacterium]|nr:Gfo/Idh/MocA family oxidoreductase [Chloroflexota bacterium]
MGLNSIRPSLTLCVIGCGAYAAHFCENLKRAQSPAKLFFASRDLSKARDYCHRFGGSGFFGSYQQAAEAEEIDALYVCTPHHLHREHSELGIGNGKHILVEKPITQDIDSAKNLLSSAKNAGVTLMVAENVRFLAQVRLCKRLLDEGTIGSVRLIQFQEEYPFAPGSWRSSLAQSGGGVLIDGGIHKIHAMRYLAGEPVSVSAIEPPKVMEGREGEDSMVLQLRWAGGAAGIINHSWTAATPLRPSLTIAGTRGRISLEIGDGRVFLDTGQKTRSWNLEPDFGGIPAMVREFEASISGGRAPETSGEEGLNDLKLVLAAYDSAQTGKEIRLDDP